MSERYLAYQLSGPIANAVEDAAKARFSPSDIELEYMHDLSIDTAEADVLYDIGLLAGIPWPICPVGTYDTNRFTMDAASGSPHYSAQLGFGSVSSLTGGIFSSVAADVSIRIPIGQYRQIAKIVAAVRRTNLTLKAVDDLVCVFTTNYTLSWDAHYDLTFTFLPHIDTGTLYTLQLILDKFMIDFRVSLVQG
jgi:hypothetical protein